jgi:hypothetical protein
MKRNAAWIKLKYGAHPDPGLPEVIALHRPLPIERLARHLREPWKTLTLRKLRKRRRSAQRPDGTNQAAAPTDPGGNDKDSSKE